MVSLLLIRQPPAPVVQLMEGTKFLSVEQSKPGWGEASRHWSQADIHKCLYKKGRSHQGPKDKNKMAAQSQKVETTNDR